MSIWSLLWSNTLYLTSVKIPLATSTSQLIVPNFGLGFSIGKWTNLINTNQFYQKSNRIDFFFLISIAKNTDKFFEIVESSYLYCIILYLKWNFGNINNYTSQILLIKINYLMRYGGFFNAANNGSPGWY